VTTFTASHRGGSGPPLVLLHGFADTWRTWELVLPKLEREHDVLALTLAGHAGGPAFDGEPSHAAILAAVERAMDEAGFTTAHVAGNSLGGYLALRLAARKRARSVVALAPAGGWGPDDESYRATFAMQARMIADLRAVGPHVDAFVATPEGRRMATRAIVNDSAHLPNPLVAHILRGAAACTDAEAMIDSALRSGWALDAAAIDCPVRIVWGTEDVLLPWPSAAHRYRHDWLPHAGWVELDGVGHAPQLEVPLEAAELILGVTAR
jgi:pimeloyl-ACP methyl ester carboxylesterase